MKKPVSTSLTILLLLFTLILIGCKIHVQASPTTKIVDDNGPADFDTIQDAINNATDGDTILVRSGTYHENVIINKSVSLLGEDRETTIIDGGETGSVIFLTATNVKINGFTIQKSGTALYDSGILVTHSRGNDISHNKITDNYHGIYLSYTRDNTISNNNIYSNKINGISLDSSNNNHVISNNISSNYVNGIRLASSSGNTIWGNNVNSNKVTGIRLDSSNNNIVSCNSVYSNEFNGFRLDFSSSNTIWGNNVDSNNDYGIRLDPSSNNNIIYHNNLNNTMGQVSSDSKNVWDYNGEGNYWNNYTGQDINGDGIGDTPHVIDVNNKDNYPLMGRFSDFKVPWKDKTYHATTICNSTISNFRFEVGGETGNKIIRFDVTGENGTVGFCRVMIPTELMNYPYVVLVDEEEVVSTLLDVSNETHAHLYFTYLQSSHNISVISSKLLYLYNELLNNYTKLYTDFYNLNLTYQELLENYAALLGNYSELLESYGALNASYQQHLQDYLELQANHTSLLLEHAQNIQNLTYVFTVITAIFIIAAVYLSTHAHRRVSRS